MNRPLVIDIKRHTLENSQGVRTTILFKGCQMHCLWCHNPEAIDPDVEIGFYPDECLSCGRCAKGCPTGACSLSNPERIDRELCVHCGLCTEVCPGSGLRLIGTYYSSERLFQLVLQDSMYYEFSGVTLSGGEPTLHMEYISILLKMLKQEGIHTAIETNGFFPGLEFQKYVLDFLDLIYFDIKLVNPDIHRLYTGRDNDLILNNLAMLVRICPEKMVIRMPLIPGITTTTEARQAMSGLLRKFGIKECVLLPYNSLGHSKRQNLGKSFNLPDSKGLFPRWRDDRPV